MNTLGILFKNIADAIREKTGDTATMKPNDFPTKISDIKADSSDSGLMNVIKGLVGRDATETSGTTGLLAIPKVMASNGNVVITLNEYARAGFDDAEYAKFNGTTWYYDYSLAYYKKLRIVEVEIDDTSQGLGVMFGPYSLYGCTMLESLIIRFTGTEFTSSVKIGVLLGSGNGILEGTNNTFYIYVSRVLYDKAVANNSPYSGRIRKLEDYPDIDNWQDNL